MFETHNSFGDFFGVVGVVELRGIKSLQLTFGPLGDQGEISKNIEVKNLTVARHFAQRFNEGIESFSKPEFGT